MLKIILKKLKSETVLCISGLLAVVTMFLVPPSKSYIENIDFRVLTLLFALMCVVQGWQKIGVFERLGQGLLRGIENSRQLEFVLIGLCFFSSMLITNDVALITFVPFTIMLLPMAGQKDKMVFVIVMQTIAANLGSMLLPIGNPQNLYLFSTANMNIGQFIWAMFPLWCISFIILYAILLFRKKVSIEQYRQKSLIDRDKKQEIIYTVLFIMCILCVVRILPYQILLVIVIVTILLVDRVVFTRVDYGLLLTFVFFFLFIGNMKQLTSVTTLLSEVLKDNELIAGIISSQVISNVPSAILLSGFTNKYIDLLRGVNIGGLGTLIASLASVISYKFFSEVGEVKKSSYMLQFTMWNSIFLVLLYITTTVIL